MRQMSLQKQDFSIYQDLCINTQNMHMQRDKSELVMKEQRRKVDLNIHYS